MLLGKVKNKSLEGLLTTLFTVYQKKEIYHLYYSYD